MSWDSELPTIIRYLINDVSDTPTYTDDRLAVTALISAMQVQQTCSFPTRFAVSVENESMIPDCTRSPTRDESFINLTSLKSAVIIMQNEVKLNIGQGIRIKDVTGEIDLKRDPKSLALLIETYKDAYDEAVFLYKRGQTEVGEAVVGPIKSYFNSCDGPYYRNFDRGQNI